MLQRIFHVFLSHSDKMFLTVSGAHLNPAISLSMCVLGRLQWLKLPIYCTAQLIGAFIGAAAVFGLYYGKAVVFIFALK